MRSSSLAASEQGRQVLRGMRPLDLPAVCTIERENYEFPWSEKIFRDCLRVGYCCRVLGAAERVLGYGVMSAAAAEAHILNLCVDRLRQARGLGRVLLEDLLEQAVASGSVRVFLEVRPSNLIAQHLYQSAGFERIGIRRRYYRAREGREDAIVLTRELF